MFAARNEIEYLSSMDGKAFQDPIVIREMARRLDALRRYDQHFYDASWRPDRTSLRPVRARNRRNDAHGNR